MLVRDAGEFRLIELLAGTLVAEGLEGSDDTETGAWRPRVGIGDDAAVWDGEAGTRVLSTDAMVEEVHFELGLTRLARPRLEGDGRQSERHGRHGMSANLLGGHPGAT